MYLDFLSGWGVEGKMDVLGGAKPSCRSHSIEYWGTTGFQRGAPPPPSLNVTLGTSGSERKGSGMPSMMLSNIIQTQMG